MNILGLKRDPSTVSEEGKILAKEILPEDGLERLLDLSDVVVAVLPLTADTKHYLRKEHFDRMKKSSIFVNIGRGKTVVEKDLILALQSGSISGAVLDVFEKEPIAKDNPLWTMPNVVNTQHSADYAGEYGERVVGHFKEELERFIKGEPLQAVVSKKSGY